MQDAAARHGRLQLLVLMLLGALIVRLHRVQQRLAKLRPRYCAAGTTRSRNSTGSIPR
ncbi:hypothetical protein NOVOSPHI9U_10625 [Novosphingobium sp. 9U]|nr:hypothetical protein NOVOSPHI9U_10625 [Novosphingobium sp. 9U]